ncbi:MAG: SpoIIE family protein phosphatase [Armatimonadota bacterium]
MSNTGESASAAESRRRIAYLEALSQIQSDIASQQTLNHILDKVIQSIIDILEESACAIFLLDPDGKTLTCKASKGVICSEYDKPALDGKQIFMVERVLETKKMAVLDDTRKESDLRLPALENGRLPMSVASVPIMVGQGRLVGALVAYSEEPRTFDEEELHFLNTLAGSVGVSVIHADAYTESEKQRTWLNAVLRAVPSAVIISQKPGDRLALANERAEGLLGRKLERGMPLTEIPEKSGIFELDGSPIPNDRFPLYRASAYGEPSDLIEMLIIQPDGERIIVQGNAIPMYDENGNISGAVGIMEDVTRLKAMQATVEEALEKERYLSKTIQKALIPDIPERTSGLVIGSVYDTAFSENYMGGDFFDVFSPNTEQVSIVIGDVSGKGLRAAVITALVRYTLRSYGYENPSPKHLIEKLNDVVASEIAPGEFATLFYGLWDVEEQSLSFVNAGHEPPLYLACSESEARELPSSGSPVGVFPGSLYKKHSLRLSSGDRLLLYTDGVTDARGDKDFFGLEALKDFFVAKRQESPGEFAAQLMSHLKEYSNGQLRDDIAILLISAS